MTWTAKIVSSAKNDLGLLVINVIYVNDQTGLTDYKDSFTGITDDSLLQQRIQERLNFLAAQASYTPATGPVVLPTPIAVDPLAAAARNQFAQDLLALKRYNGAVSLGFMAPTDKLITDLKAKLLANWTLDYLTLMPII